MVCLSLLTTICGLLIEMIHLLTYMQTDKKKRKVQTAVKMNSMWTDFLAGSRKDKEIPEIRMRIMNNIGNKAKKANTCMATKPLPP